MTIAVIGSIFVDIKGYPSDIYISQGRNAGRVEQVHGGVGRNVAADISGMGFDTVFISLVDYSGMGEDVIRKLNDCSICTEYIARVNDGMGTWLAVFDHNGDVVGSISKRPDMSYLTHILEESGDSIFKAADSIVLQLDMELSTVEKTLSLAEIYGKDVYAVISNMSIVMERKDYLKSLSCVVCNIQEAEMLFSEEYSTYSIEEMITEVRHKAHEHGLRRLVITMGGEGAVYCDIDGTSGFCPAKKVQVVDTTGAGDAFLAGVAAGLTTGKNLADACKTGSCLAAAVIGTSENICQGVI